MCINVYFFFMTLFFPSVFKEIRLKKLKLLTKFSTVLSWFLFLRALLLDNKET